MVRLADRDVGRLGLGTMRLTGPGAFGAPPDLDGARAVLHAARELGIAHVDTANSFGPLFAELLVREVLHPYDDVLVATKGGMLRPAPFKWINDGRPEALRAAVDNSCKLLGVDAIPLWYLQRVDPAVPADDQFGAIAELVRAGKIRHVGLCEVTIEQLESARRHFTVAAVQSRYHVIDRRNDAVLAHCERANIPFVTFFPLATGALAAADSILARIARDLGATPAQVALAWLLRRSPAIVAIPGTSRVDHVRENAAAATLALDDAHYAEIDRIGRKAALLRAPAP